MEEKISTKPKLSGSMLWQMFRTFALIGSFTFGGGYAMLEQIRHEIVDRHKWMTDEEFIDLFVVAQSLPGVFAVNISIFVGYRLQGFIGALVCTLGTTLPIFIIILLIAMYASHIKDNPTVEAVFKGIRPAVVALIAAPAVTMWRSLKLSWKLVWIPIVCALSVWWLGVSPVTVIVVSAFAGWLYYKFVTSKIEKPESK